MTRQAPKPETAYRAPNVLKLRFNRLKLKLSRFSAQRPAATRLFAAISAGVMVFGIGYEVFNARNFVSSYELSQTAASILPQASPIHADYLKLDEQAGRIDYNAGYLPSMAGSGQSARPKFQASFGLEPKDGMSVTDVVNSTTVSFKPKFGLLPPQIQTSRLVYPLRGRDGAKVVSLGASGFKEDIILNKARGDSAEFKYEMVLPEGVEPRLERDGSIGFYGVESSLLGDIPTGSEQDAELLSKARANGEKKQLLFTIPVPLIFESRREVSTARAEFELNGSELIIKATGLESASYPLSIDPSIYVETAAKLMRGNNETNIDFDVDNELIQKSQTTGARIDAWEGNLDLNEGIWDHSSAVAGGYIYRTGGRNGPSKPQLLGQQVTTESTEDSSFQMDMPAERPAGDLYIAMMCHDSSTDTVSPPAGWTEYADIGEHAAYYKVGTDQGGGNESANYTWTISSSEAKAGVIVRVRGFNTADPVSGLPGTDSDSGIPEFPATTPDNSASLVIRAVGADNDVPSDTGWVPAGHTKIASDTSGGSDCGFVAATLDNPPASGVSTGTASLDDSSINDSWGASSIAINPASSATPPVIAGQQSSTQTTNSSSFAMSMPSTRPAGDLYIALMCHDGTGTVSPPGGGGWTEYADSTTREHAAYYKIGTDQGGGNESASYTWTGSSEKWGGVIVRVTGFDSSDPVSGTPGLDSDAGNSTPEFPATTPDTNSTLIIRAAGADNDTPSSTAWVPAGHTKIDSGGPGGSEDCGYVAAALNESPAAGVSTGTVDLDDGSIDDTWGSSTIAINANPAGGFTEEVRSTVDWAKFNSSTLAIESPNPGDGVCPDWCNDADYNLPEPRRGHSMVAYNGYLYVIGGADDDGNRESTVLIAKLGVNGEPALWHPTDTDKANWDYWYSDSGLSGSTARSYLSAVAYNNRMYILGGQTNAASGGTTTMEYADIRPNGTLASWSSGTSLPGSGGRHSHTAHIYNDVLYLIGGNISGTLQNSVHYVKLNSDGSMNSWIATNSFTTARATMGGAFTAVWGAYIYLGGGCTAVNGSGYCTSVANDMQLASINADGTVTEWGSILGLDNQRVGYTFLAWQNGLYRLGGCGAQNTTDGTCTAALADVDFGVINPAGEVSTVSISTPSGSGDCSGGSPFNCDLPPPGDDAGEGGQLLSMSAILNGYLYNIGGCVDYDCDGTNPAGDDSDASGNVSYVAIDSSGRLSPPSSCGGTSYGAWCVDSANKINETGSNTTDGVAAGGVTTFNNRIYVVGGVTGNNGSNVIYHNAVNADGSLDGDWEDDTFAAVGISGEIAYTFAYARANPSSAGTNPGNLYVLGGCGDVGTGVGCAGSDYRSEVYKCNIEVDGDVSGCTTTGQLQIDSELGDEGNDGLGIHSGTVYANYVYLIGGFSANVADRDTVFYARFDNNNNIVDVDSGTVTGNDDDWIEETDTLSVGRRRGWAFGYNGHIYAVGGYDDSGTGIIPFIEWSKMNVSDGSIDEFITSSVTINQRWGLSMVVSNSYAYVIGGCDVGASPGSCSSFENSIQTFQLYNNESGAVSDFTAQSDDTFATADDRIGAASAVYNGYLYVAGGCTNIGCTTVTDNVQFAQISATDGSVGTWSSTTDSTLPGVRAWGKLEAAGGTLYYIGGQTATATDERPEVYYGTPSSGNVSAWNTVDSANDLPNGRTQHGSAVWNNRLYVVGGIAASSGNPSNVVYVSPDLSAGGDIPSTWSTTTAFNVARTGTAVTAYANNLYLFGGFDGTNYLSDAQFTQINSDGTVDAWTYTTSLPGPLRDATAVSANGYIYLVGGRSAATTCVPNTIITPISANTTIASGNNPTGVGEWYETNVRYAGDRYGAAVAYDDGKIYTMAGGCAAMLDCSTGTVCNYQSTVKSQPQVAMYSRLIDTDTDVFPNAWLMNGLDNSIGARWQVRYRSMNDTDGIATDCGPADMTTWGQETNYGEVTLGDVAPYVPLNSSGTDIDCARYFYFFVSIDASKTFGYPEDVNRGPTIADITLFFTSDPSKRLRHGKTFTGGLKQPLDTPCRQSVDSDCPSP